MMVIPYINAIKSVFSYLNSTITGDARIRGMPVAVSSELTNFCNLKCPECPSGKGLLSRERGYMDLDLFDRLLSELGPYLLYLTLYFQGEPMMHPRFFDFLVRARHLNTILSTNGHFLSWENSEKIVSSGLKKIIISVDGMDQYTYSSYRKNGNLDIVIDGLNNLSEARKGTPTSLKLEIQCLVNKKNEHQITDLQHLANKYDAVLKLKSMQIINPEDYETWLPSEMKFSRYRKEGDYYKIKSNLPGRCSRLWFNPVVTWDGKVIPCCFDKNADYVMGNLNEKSFREIWFGQEYRNFRNKVFTSRREIEMCCNCTSGLKGVRY